MATMNVKDAAGSTVAVEKPLAPGRADAASSRPVALATEDKAALDAVSTGLTTLDGRVDGLETLIAATNTKLDSVIAGVDGLEALLGTGNTSLAAIETAAEDTTTPSPVRLAGQTEYETVAASQTAQVLGATGAAGDFISHLLVIPATTSPGNVLLLDNATSITVFAGGASSVSNLAPFVIPLNMKSVSGAWKVTTGANVSAVAVGDFT